MKGWILVSLLVFSTTFNISMSQLEPCEARSGGVRVIGLNNNDAFAGRMELCYNGWWRAVCAGNWDSNDAEVVCQQMLNLPQSEILVQVCTDSCYGKSSLSLGIRGFGCTGMKSRLIDCTRTNNNAAKCQQDAGFVCYKRPEDTCVTTSQCETPTTAGDVHTTCPPQECDCTHTNIELTSEIESGRGEQQKTETSSCTGLGGGLGTLAGISVLILVGVILVWVWSCYRNGKQDQYSSHGPDDIRSPSATTSASHPTPSTIATDETSATHPTCNTVTKTSKKQREQTWKIDVGNENATVGEYSVLKNTGREGGGGDDVVYQVLEGPGVFTYEAPVPAMASPAANQPGNTPATNAVTQDEEYSTLKY